MLKVTLFKNLPEDQNYPKSFTYQISFNPHEDYGKATFINNSICEDTSLRKHACPRSHSQQMAEPGFKSKTVSPTAPVNTKTWRLTYNSYCFNYVVKF